MATLCNLKPIVRYSIRYKQTALYLRYLLLSVGDICTVVSCATLPGIGISSERETRAPHCHSVSGPVRITDMANDRIVDRDAIELFQEYLRIPSVHPNVNYGECINVLINLINVCVYLIMI